MAKKEEKQPTQQQDAQNQLPLFYHNPIALDREKHAKMSLNPKMTFTFAAEANAVPINLVEFPYVAPYYPIAFSASEPSTPLAILGLKNKENLFVNDKGEWAPNTYIPAYVRRYPFIVAQDSTGERLTLCIDDAKGVMIKDKKNPFFDKKEPTDLTKNALDFCRSYQRAALDTEKFMAELKETGVLSNRHAQIRTPDGKTSTLSGFLAVDEQKLKDLPDAKVVEWHKSGLMRFIHAQLVSTGNWQKLFWMMGQTEENNASGNKKKK